MSSTAPAPEDSLVLAEVKMENDESTPASSKRFNAADSKHGAFDRLRSLEMSARLHAMRATFFEGVAREREAQIAAMRRSTSWRLTAPIRFAAHVLREGPSKPGRLALSKFHSAWRQLQQIRSGNNAPAIDEESRGVYRAPAVHSAQRILAPRVLIIAELSLTQCAKYRVWQRQEYLQRLGFVCTVLRWQQIAECRSALQTHALVIFFRVPGFPDSLALIDEAHRLGVTSYWEVDDLIFDKPSYLKNRNLDFIDPKLRAEVLSGVELYRAAMLSCDRGIASTPALAEAMRSAGLKEVIVIENALDQETIEYARLSQCRRAEMRRQVDGVSVVIGYGSGSKAHNADFLEVCPALASLMLTRPEVELHIMGELELPKHEFEAFENRIKRQPGSDYATYLDWLATCDISLAPLEDTAFNESKSNIKFLEAAVLGLPCVCSPRRAFREVVESGVNGFLADTQPDWLATLEALVDSSSLRERIGASAKDFVLVRYGPHSVEAQLEPFVRGLDQRDQKKLSVLAVNIFFSPHSYGGATIVAEEMARRLNASSDFNVAVFTSHGLADQQPYTLLRYRDASDVDIPIIAVKLPNNFGDPIAGFDDPQMVKCFDEVLASVEPDIVHFHCLQGLSSAILDMCHDRKVPFVITLHDAWWLCERQFMVNGKGKYCGQRRIDVRVCEACIPGAQHLNERLQMSMQRLSGAARLLFPSKFHMALHISNGISSGLCRLNRNGVRAPAGPRQRRQSGVLRFAYVGGNDHVKGIHLIKAAFENLQRDDFELVLVDNTTNAGYSSMRADDWKVRGVVDVIPGYKQDEMDRFYQNVDVLLFPTQWKESFGLAVREALLRDVWVIATDGGGTVEDIVHGENGTILPFEATASELGAAIIELLDRPDRLAGYSNPYKGRITTYDDQAQELGHILREIAFS
jgi:glycosyltransferase involved in cell wall biosynthesis